MVSGEIKEILNILMEGSRRLKCHFEIKDDACTLKRTGELKPISNKPKERPSMK